MANKADYIFSKHANTKKLKSVTDTDTTATTNPDGSELTQDQKDKLQHQKDNPWLYQNRYSMVDGNLQDMHGFTPEQWAELPDSTRKKNYYELMDKIKLENEEYYKKYPNKKRTKLVPPTPDIDQPGQAAPPVDEEVKAGHVVMSSFLNELTSMSNEVINMDKTAQEVDPKQFPLWVQEALQTGIQETDAEGNVIGQISPEAMMDFIKKNPPKDMKAPADAGVKEYWDNRANEVGPSDAGVKEYWDDRANEVGPSDAGVEEYWNNKKEEVGPADKGIKEYWDQQKVPTDSGTKEDKAVPGDSNTPPSNSKVEDNEPVNRSLSYSRVNPNISGDLGREGRVNNVFQNLRKKASAMPTETPHDKASKKAANAAKWLSKKYKDRKKKGKK